MQRRGRRSSGCEYLQRGRVGENNQEEEGRQTMQPARLDKWQKRGRHRTVVWVLGAVQMETSSELSAGRELVEGCTRWDPFCERFGLGNLGWHGTSTKPRP